MLAYQVCIGLWHRTALAATWIPWDTFVNLWVSLDHKSEHTILAPSLSNSKFSNLSEHQNQMNKLLKHRLLGPRKSELSDSVNLGAPNSLHLSQVLRWCPCCQLQKHCSVIWDYLCSPFAFPAPCPAISLPECLLLLLSHLLICFKNLYSITLPAQLMTSTHTSLKNISREWKQINSSSLHLIYPPNCYLYLYQPNNLCP